ncbi:MAG: DNA cytosine methyltransferase, partial [Fusobacteriaceae bacterium]
MRKVTLFECFAGYSSQHMAAKKVWRGRVDSIGISEVDADVIISNGAIHHPEEFNSILNRDLTDTHLENAKKWLKDRNIGFDFESGKSKIDRMPKGKVKKLAAASIVTKNYGDVSLCNVVKLNQKIDIFTYSSPCQSFSVAGKLEGLKGTSGLLLECEKFIEINKPKVLMLENVKNLVGKQFKGDFDNWCEVLESLGYKNYWKVL